jgi:hypothetical protein
MPQIQSCGQLSHAVQNVCRDWHRIGAQQIEGGMFGVGRFGALFDLHVRLGDRLDDAGLLAALDDKAQMLRALAVVIFHKAAECLGDDAPDPSRRIDPMAISLEPARWGADGLFSEHGLTLDEALALTPGSEQLWFPGSRVVAPAG